MPLPNVTPRRRALAKIWRFSLKEAKYREGEIMRKEFCDVFGIIIDSAEDIPMIPTTLTSWNISLENNPSLSLSHFELFYNSLGISHALHNDLEDLSQEGLGELYRWSDMYEVYGGRTVRWGFVEAWTTGDLTALVLSIHSRSAMNNEILTSEFIAFYRIARYAWRNDDSTQQELEKEMMEKQSPQSSASRSASRRLPIRLVSIHNHNIRILSTVITEEYLKSLEKDGPPSSSELQVHIKSISVAEYSEAQMKDLALELLSPSSQVKIQDSQM